MPLWIRRQRQKGSSRRTSYNMTHGVWPMYANQQAAHISEMGSPSKRNKTNRGLWNEFLAGTNSLPDVHNVAFQAYIMEEVKYGRLAGQQTFCLPAGHQQPSL